MNVIVVDSLIDNEYTFCLCAGLSNAGVEVYLIVPENRRIWKPVNFFVKHWAPPKDQSASKFLKIFKYISYLVNLAKFIVKSDTRIVHFQFFRCERFESFYFLLLRLLKVKLIYTAHNLLPHESKFIDPFLKSIVYNSSSAIIVHSEYVKQQLIERFHIGGNKVHVIPHGNFDIYLPQQPISKKFARERLGLGEHDQILLFFGMIREYKGLDVLLEAFEMTAIDNPNLCLLIGGSANEKKLEEHYRTMIAQLRFKDRIFFHAKYVPYEEVAIYFSATDVVVLPYKHIYHSGIIHLALSFRKPIIATKVGDLPEIIEHGKTGFLVEANNPQKLMHVIHEAFQVNTNLEEMGQKIKTLNRAKYSWDNIGQQTVSLYRSLI